MTGTTGQSTTTPAITATSTTALAVFKSIKSKFGGIREVYKDSWVPWILFSSHQRYDHRSTTVGREVHTIEDKQISQRLSYCRHIN